MKSQVTLAICTKDRPQLLSKCLHSVRSQTILPESILLIDNGIKKTASPIAKTFQSFLPIKYFAQTQGNLAQCRNLALKLCQTRLIAFTDDDCLLNANWLSTSLACLNSKATTAVTGLTNLANPHIWLARSQYYYYRYWLIQNSTPTLDTKNCVIKIKAIRTARLQFDPQLVSQVTDIADVDFSLQLQKHALKIVFCPKMVLIHPETENLNQVIIKWYQKGRLFYKLNQHWHYTNRYVDPYLVRPSYLYHQRLFWKKELINYAKVLRLTPSKLWPSYLLIKFLELSMARGYRHPS